MVIALVNVFEICIVISIYCSVNIFVNERALIVVVLIFEYKPAGFYDSLPLLTEYVNKVMKNRA